ncbi:MAG TPA: hypothetical protein VFF70_07690 [Anaerolineae bacterium]|nr:hypothetical protein [Anaerolineae bacterium]
MDDHPPFPHDQLTAAIDALLDRNPRVFSIDRWSIHGVRFEFHVDHPLLRDLMRSMLHSFPIDPTGPTDVRMCLTTYDRWSIPMEAEIFPSQANEIIDLKAAYGLTPKFGRWQALNFYELTPLGGVVYQLKAGQALGYVHDPASFHPWFISHLLMQLIVLDLLRSQDLFWMHAACVADHDRGVLLAGQSGSGKTTTCLRLIEGGFKFLSEDRTFFRSVGGAIELLSFIEAVSVTQNSLKLLPALSKQIGSQEFGARYKIDLDPAQLFPNALLDRASPGLILFPRVTSSEQAATRRLNSAGALQMILPSSLLASQPDVSGLHFDALTQLVTSSRCYELLLGRDVDRLPELVRGLLNQPQSL